MSGVIDSVLASVTILKAAVQTFVQLSRDYNTLSARISGSPGIPSLPTTRSHWQETIPESARLLHASSTPLPDHADIVIIGSGITGTLVARVLLEHPHASDLKIVMIEARDVCTGATSRNGGHIKCDPHLIYHKHKLKHGKPFAEKATRFSMAHIDELIRISEKVGGNERTEARCVETVDAYFDRALFARACEKVKRFEEEMPAESKGIVVLDAKEAQEKYGLSPICVGAIVSQAGAINPYKLVTALLTSFEEKYPDSITQPSSERPLYALTTSKGEITTPHVVHATNAHASHLVPGLRSKIFPLRQVMTAQTHSSFPSTQPTPGGRSFSFLYAEGFDYLTERPDGTIMLGGGFAQGPQQGMAEVGVPTDDAYDAATAAHVCGALSVLFKPPARDKSASVQSIWAGSIGISADLLPWVGRLPTSITGRGAPLADSKSWKIAPPGEWISAGYSGEGMVNAPLCAKALAMMILKPNEAVGSWFPDEMRITEKRCRKADPSGILDGLWD
ncbi:FAD-binding domain protein [Ceratobasidium sp. AG-Ba]|nr:FAD-binding domain protein [Ceratobasidium sp. AG-Ba]